MDEIERFRVDSGVQADYKRGESLVIAFYLPLWISLFACGRIHQSLDPLVMNLEEDQTFVCVWLLYLSIRG